MIFEAQTFFLEFPFRSMPCTNSASDALHPLIPICFRAADGMMVVM